MRNLQRSRKAQEEEMDWGSITLTIGSHVWQVEGIAALGGAILISAPILYAAYRVAFT